MGSKLWTCVI